MKKLKLMVLFYIGIIGFFAFNLIIHANQEFAVKIDSIKDTIEFKNQGIQISKKSLRTYALVTEEDEILGYHLLPQEEEYGLILYKGYVEGLYTLEGFILKSEIKTCLQEIGKEDFEYLIKDAEPILDESELGEKLKRNQERFEVNHKYIVSKPADSGIETYGLERHNRSVEKMTSTDEYIDGYTPTYENTSGYIRTYTDNIINIVPEEWFFKEGSYAYVGKEYAIAVSTKEVNTPSYGAYCMLARVAVFDIEVALPYLNESENSGNNKPYCIAMSEKISIKINPLFSYSYYGYEKKNFSSEVWNRNFDIGETRTVVARRDSASTIYIAPKSMGILIDDSKSIQPNTLRINHFSYEMRATSRIFELLDQVEMRGLKNDTIANLAELIVNLGIAAAPEVGLPIKALEKLIINFIKIYNHNSTGKLRTDLKIKNSNFQSDIYSQKFNSNYKSDSDKPIIYAINHNRFDSIFKNVVLKDYSFLYEIELHCESNWYPIPNYFYSINISSEFDFYDNYSFFVNNIMSNQTYDNLNLNIDNVSYDGSKPGFINVYNGTQITTNLSTTKPSSTLIISPTYTGITELKLNSTSSVIVDVYDEDGNVIQTNSAVSNNLSVLFKVTSGGKYFIFLRFRYSTSGSITLGFKKLSDSYTSVSTNITQTKFKMNSSNEYINVQYLMLSLGGGQYSFSTNTEYDTSIRAFDENGHLLGESYDPNADWNEDEPDLNAHLYLNLASPKKVIIEIRMFTSLEYYVNVFYSSHVS